jgi:hypothetical protein
MNFKNIKWTVRNIVIAVWSASWIVIALLIIILPN